jgi:tRNA 2-selenouridine synthase
MQESKLDIREFFDRDCPVADVRSPAEYMHGHIPGAVSMPLFSNEERSLIGTLYVQQGSGEAIKKGLELTGPKMKDFVEKAGSLAPDGELSLYCWRGGMRSNSLAWLFNTSGLKACTLEGGYRAYRRYVHEYYNQPFSLIVIGGMTGSGKTEILEVLGEKGFQVIHLENLASHKGSVFGHLGMEAQPSTEQFENNLFGVLKELDPRKPAFIEDESLSVGRVFIPRSFYTRMSQSPFLKLNVPFDARVRRLVLDYGKADPDDLVASVSRIERRLGKENAAKAIGFIRDNRLEDAVRIILQYYDKIYTRSMAVHDRKISVEVDVANESKEEIAISIIEKIQMV